MRRAGPPRALAIPAACFAAVLLTARVAAACGPFLEYPVFTYETHPDFPLTHYAAGRLGVIQPKYAPSYLFVAYRYLAGIGLEETGRAAVLDLWREAFNGPAPAGEPPLQEWVRVRARVSGVGPPASIATHRRDENWMSYPNCLDDAFRHAARTLGQRIEDFGADSPHTLSWVRAQDTVFANCSGDRSIPEPAADDAPLLLRADRAYQIAAAHFYAGDLNRAEELFRAIAADPTSPWQGLSTYLVARALIRAKRLQAAEAQLSAVLADASLAPLHGAARGLLGFVTFRLRPTERYAELARALVQPAIGPTFRQDLSDYTRLGHGVKGAAEDLNAWMAAFTTSAPGTVDTWREKRTVPWLVAALSATQGEDPRADELLDAARNVPPDSPAYLTVAYHRLRLFVAAGRHEEARLRLDALLAGDGAAIPPSSRNLFLSLRAGLARDLDEFLVFAQQVPLGIIGFWGYERMVPNDRVGWRENEVQFNVDGDLGGKPLAPRLDDQAEATLDILPVRSLIAAVEHRGLDPNLRRRILLAAWTRAMLLGDDASARALFPRLETSIPELHDALQDYGRAESREERHFAGVLAMLRAPGVSPLLDDREGTPLLEIDDFRRNWWCPIVLQRPDDAAPSFVGAEELAAARSETAGLDALPAGPRYLAAEALEWARAHRRDPRVPEALHLAVRSTRYGCTDGGTGELSRAAFRLLHRRYPKSEWTARTPYWFD